MTYTRRCTQKVVCGHNRGFVNTGGCRGGLLCRAKRLRKLCRSTVRRHIVAWVDNWWHVSIRANPVKPDVYLDVSARAIVHTPPPFFLVT